MMTWILSSTVLMTVVIALRYLLRGKIHPTVQYALWGLVLVRLLLPFSIAGNAASLSSAVDRTTFARDMDRLQYVERVDRDTDGTIRGWGPTITDPYGDPMTSYTKVADSADDAELLRLQRTTGLKNFARNILLPVWYVGIGVMAAWFLLVNIIFSRRLRKTRHAVCQSGKLQVYATPIVETPCLFGFFSPAIYVTPDVAADETALRHVLAHEMTHYRHKDHLWSLLRVACLCLHWYHPLVWWSAALSRRDGELACDAGSLSILGEAEREDYGRTLVALSCGRVTPSALLTTATTMSGGKQTLKERISLIARKPQTKAAAVFALVVIAAFAALFTFTGSAPKGSYLHWSARNVNHGINYRTHYARDVDTVTVHVEQYENGIPVANAAETYTGDLKYLSVKFYGTWYDVNTGEVVEAGHVSVLGNGGNAFTMDVPYAAGNQENDVYNFIQWCPKENVSFTADTKFTLGIVTCGYEDFTALPISSESVNERSVGEYQMLLNSNSYTGSAVLVWAEFCEPSAAAATPSSETGIVGRCDFAHTHTTEEGNGSTFYSFDGIKKATLAIELYQDGILTQEGHQEVRNLTWLEAQIHEDGLRSATPLAGDSEPVQEADWFVVLTNSDDKPLDLGFTARGIPMFSHYMDGSSEETFPLAPGETYPIASAAWDDGVTQVLFTLELPVE